VAVMTLARAALLLLLGALLPAHAFAQASPPVPKIQAQINAITAGANHPLGFLSLDSLGTISSAQVIPAGGSQPETLAALAAAVGSGSNYVLTNATTTAIGAVQISAGVAALGGTPTLALVGTHETLAGLDASGVLVTPAGGAPETAAAFFGSVNQPSGIAGLDAGGGIIVNAVASPAVPGSGKASIYVDRNGILHADTASINLGLFGPYQGLTNAWWTQSPFGFAINATDAYNQPNIHINRSGTNTQPGNAILENDLISPNITNQSTVTNLWQTTVGQNQSGLATQTRIVVTKPAGYSGTPFAANITCNDDTGQPSSISGGCEGLETDTDVSGPDDGGDRATYDSIVREFVPTSSTITQASWAFRARGAIYGGDGPSVTGPSQYLHPFASYSEKGFPGSGNVDGFWSDGGNLHGVYLFSSLNPFTLASSVGFGASSFTFVPGKNTYNLQSGYIMSDSNASFAPGTSVTSVTTTGVGTGSVLTTVGFNPPTLKAISSGATVDATAADTHGFDANGYFLTDAASLTSQFGPEFFVLNGVTSGNPAGGPMGVGTVNTEHGVFENGTPIVASVAGHNGTVSTSQLYTALKGSLGTSGTLADAGDVQTAITGLGSTYITSSQSTAAISTALMGYVSGSQNDVTAAKVIAQYGTQGMSEAQAASLGLLDIRAYGGVSDFQSGYAVGTGTAGSTTVSFGTEGQAASTAGRAFVHGVDDAADQFGHLKRISIDGGGAQPTSGPLAADPSTAYALIAVTNPGVYDQSGFPEPLLSNTGGGAGAVIESVWHVSQVQLTQAPAGCTSLTGKFYVVGGEVPTTVTMTPNGSDGMAETVGTDLPITFSGSFIDQIQGGNAHIFRLANNDGTYCQTPGQVSLQFGLDHVSIRNQAGGGYPATGTIGADGPYPSAVVASLSGGGTPLTPAVLGAVQVQIWTPPLNTTIASVVNATTLTLGAPLGSTLPATPTAYRWAHDDLPAFQAAAAVANSPGSAGGASRPIYLPPGVWYTTGAIPPFTNSGGLRGAGLLKSIIFAEPSSSYDVDSCDNNSLITVPATWQPSSVNLTAQLAGCDLQGFTVTSDLTSAYRINANVMAGRDYFVQAGDLGAAYVPGSAFSSGAVYNSEPASGVGESSFGYMWFRSDGSWRQGGGSCTLDLDSRGSGYIDNELHFDRDVRVYAPQGGGACIYNDETTGAGASPMDFHGLIVEGQSGLMGSLPRVPANLVEIGNQTSPGKVAEIHITTLVTSTISTDFAGLKINCPSNSGFGGIHNHIAVDFQQTDSASKGPALDLECVKFGQFNFAGNDPDAGFDFKVGPVGTVSGAARITQDGLFTGGNPSYTLSIDSTAEQAIYSQVTTAGSPANPGGNITDIPGTTVTDTLQVRGCNGVMTASGSTGNVTCGSVSANSLNNGTVTNSTIDSSVIGGTTPRNGTFTGLSTGGLSATGTVNLSGTVLVPTPTSPPQAATKGYVDGAIAAGGSGLPNSYLGLWPNYTWHHPLYNSTGPTTCSPVALREYGVPIFVPAGTVLRKEGFEATTANAAGAVNIRLMLDDATGAGGLPGNVLADSGPVAYATSAATGQLSASFTTNYTMPADGVLWLVFVDDVSTSGLVINCVNDTSPGDASAFLGSGTISGAVNGLAPSGVYATTGLTTIGDTVTSFGPSTTNQTAATPAVALAN
jgi:hypothetical protein